MTTTPTPPRICPTCGAEMERHGEAWVCPAQRGEEKRISLAVKLAVKNTASHRVAGLPF